MKGLSRNPCIIKSFNAKAGTVTVAPKGHKGDEEMEIRHLLPWWSKNNDLREKYFQNGNTSTIMFHHLPLSRFYDRQLKVLMPKRGMLWVKLLGETYDGKAVIEELTLGIKHEVSLDILLPNWGVNRDLQEESFLAEEAAKGKSINSIANAFNQAKPIVAAIPDLEAKEPATCRADDPPRKESQPALPDAGVEERPEGRKEQAMNQKIKSSTLVRRIIVDPNADDDWMVNYASLKDAITLIAVTEAAIETAKREHEAACELAHSHSELLKGKGVEVEWCDEPTDTLSEVPLKKSESVDDAFDIDAPTDWEMRKILEFRKKLHKQMIPGREYNKETIVEMLQIHRLSASGNKAISWAFREKPFSFVRANTKNGTTAKYMLMAK